MKTVGYMLFVGFTLDDAIHNGIPAMNAQIYDTPEEALKVGNQPDHYPSRCVVRSITLGEPLLFATHVTESNS